MTAQQMIQRHMPGRIGARVAAVLRRFPYHRGLIAQVNVNARKAKPYTAALCDHRRRVVGRYGSFESVVDAYAATVAAALRIVASRE